MLERAATPDAADGAGLPHSFSAIGLPESGLNRECALPIHLVTEGVLRRMLRNNLSGLEIRQQVRCRVPGPR